LVKVASKVRGFALMAFLAVLAFSVPGCQKTRKLFIREPSQEVVHRPYPIKVFFYETSLVVKETPENFLASVVNDVSWLQRVSGPGSLRLFELSDLPPEIDMTDVGQSLPVDIKVLGITFSCRLITMNYKSDNEVWFMLVVGDGWMLLRFKIEPIEEGGMLSLNALGYPPRFLDAFFGIDQLVEASAGLMDLMLANLQSEFDPELDVRKATEKGLRGQMYDAFLQGHEASVWVDASPRQVKEWMFGNPDNLNNLVPNLSFKGECIDSPEAIMAHPEKLLCCPSTYRIRDMETEATALSKGEWEGEGNFDTYVHSVWIIVLDTLIKEQLIIEEQGSGSMVKMISASELPGPSNPEATDMIITISGIPERADEILLNIKAGVEGEG
jgi:hypothetical protein